MVIEAALASNGPSDAFPSFMNELYVPESNLDLVAKNEAYSAAIHHNLLSALHSQMDSTIILDINVEEFRLLLQTYQQCPEYQQPITHSSVFSDFADLEDVTSAIAHQERCLLLITCAALGAIYCGRPETARKLRDVSKRFLTLLIKRSQFEDLIEDESLVHLLQARLLSACFDAWSGEKELVESALDEQLLMVRMCMKFTSGKYERDITNWRLWIIRESFHRVYWGCFSLISDFNIAYGDITLDPLVPSRLFPLPESDVLWEEEDEERWMKLVAICNEPPTVDEATAKIIEKVDTGDYVPESNSDLSAFATCVLLRLVMHQISAANHVVNCPVYFNSQHMESHKMTTSLLQLSTTQIDRLLTHLSFRSIQFNYSPTRFSTESLLQIIELRRRKLMDSKHLGLLCSILLEYDGENTVEDFLGYKTVKSSEICQTVIICMEYITPYAIWGSRMKTFKELLCTWETVLLIIAWLRTLTLQGEPMTELEESVVSHVKWEIGHLSSEADVEKDNCYELAKRLVKIWRGVLGETSSYGTLRKMQQFFDQLALVM